MAAYIIDFEPVSRKGECRSGESLLECARRLGAGIVSICGGQGSCGACRVQVLSGTVSPHTASEIATFSEAQLKDGWRLACQAYPAGDCVVSIPSDSLTTSQRVQIEGVDVDIRPKPCVTAHQIKLVPPSLDDPQADADRLLAALNEKRNVQCGTIDYNVLQELPERLRSMKWKCRVAVRNDEIIALRPSTAPHTGLAVDLGTSKLSGYLVDLDNGQTLAKKGITNPQVNYGADIISRINHAINAKTGGVQLQKLVIKALNQLAADMCKEAGVSRADIVDMVVVGNTAMHHLLLGLPVRQLALSPYVPAIKQGIDIRARDLGLRIATGAYLHLPPNIAGFVGSDHTAVLLTLDKAENKGVMMALDIGTYTEVSIIDHGNISTVSCASGPAFEGWHIRDGMRATSGAIERLRIVDGTVQYQVIDNMPPIGICGSGILDAMAQLYLAGIVDESGRMDRNHSRVRSDDGHREFVLVSEKDRDGQPALVITQQDIRELQLAKAAIRAGIQVLLESSGRNEDEIDEIVIAGAFGTYIDIANAIAIGMLPSVPLDRVRQVGNAAGTGARLSLISSDKRNEARETVSGIHYIELAGVPDFNQIFVQANYLGKYRLTSGKREEIK
ncbi:MAG: ASKHA domain-containing protein [Dehalococcoidia bacterium]